MKLLILPLVLGLTPALAADCINLSGTYEHGDLRFKQDDVSVVLSAEKITLTQQSCDSITIRYSTWPQADTLQIGRPRQPSTLVHDDDDVTFEYTASFTGEKKDTLVVSHYADWMKNKPLFIKTYRLDENRNLVETVSSASSQEPNDFFTYTVLNKRAP